MKEVLHEIQPRNKSVRKSILVGVQFPGNGMSPVGISMEELKGLAKTAFYEPVATLTQRLVAIEPKTFLGRGKVGELQKLARFHSAEVVIFDESLSPAQNRNLEAALKCRVIDRSWLILEIFKDHAKSREAKAQVELAQLKYALPRLTRMWGHLSRQRGGIGLREVGETQIQLDRRLIRDRIHKLEQKLKRVDQERHTQRKSRKGMYKVALVGYTNAGKSTLMNCLTGAGTLVADKLFATLDSTIRKIKKNFPYPTLVSDTVGLIDKLPHDLVASFKSTMDEVRHADLLLKIVDISHPDYQEQMRTTEELLDEMGLHDTQSVWVFNKIDQIDHDLLSHALRLYPEAVPVSGIQDKGLERLRETVTNCYEKKLKSFTVNLDYDKFDLMNEIRKLALVVESKYSETGMTLQLKVPPTTEKKLADILNGNGAFH